MPWVLGLQPLLDVGEALLEINDVTLTFQLDLLQVIRRVRHLVHEVRQ